MSQELISPETVSAEKLHALFDAALLKVSREAGSSALQITGEYLLWVLLTEPKRHLRFLGMFSIPEGPDVGARIALANRINDRLISIRAAIGGEKHDRLCLDHYMCLDGGVSAKNIGIAFKEFESLVAGALQEVRTALAEAQSAKLVIERQLKSSSPESRSTSDQAMLGSDTRHKFGR